MADLPGSSATARFDLLIRGGDVIDGTGAPAARADLGVRGDRIAAVGDLSRASAGQVIEARGLCVAPGFIDIHTHSDISLLYTRNMPSSLAQGVTLEVVGNCGFSVGLATPGDEFASERRGLERYGLHLDWHDLDGFLRRIEQEGIAIHVATLAGHGTLRKRTMGLAERAPTADELTAMQRDLAEAMAAGARGLSSGLEYVPGMYADVDEIAALARVAAEAGGFYATHLRDEGDRLEESVAEAIEVAERARIPLQLSHHKAEKPRNWGKVVRTLAMVDDAAARGVDILLDQYPYTAYQTALATIALPPWAVAGTPEILARKLRDPAVRVKVRAGMGGLDWEAIEMTTCPGQPAYVGQSLAHIARETGRDPRDVVLDLLATGEGWISAAHFAMSEADVERVLADPRVMIGSDAVACDPAGPAASDKIHPRTYGTFARVLSRYVRQRGLLSLPEAIRRMTSLPARRLGLDGRGRIAPGGCADLVLFNPETIAERSTFARPHALAAGVEKVVVAGRIAWADGKPTGVRAGQVLRN